MTGHPLSAFGCPKPEVTEPATTTLTYNGEQRAKGSIVRLAARLTDGDGSPLADKLVTFSIAGQTLSAFTDADGTARTTAEVPDHGRSQVVEGSFSGDDGYLGSTFSEIISWGGPH
jgi:hypothetical protein